MKLNIRIPSNLYAISLLSALITFIVYLSSLKNDFVTWDDNLYIYTNEHISSFNLDFILWSFSDFHSGNWHPLTWISHAFDYSVWGLNPAGHHLTNILIHAVNTFLVTLLAIRLIETFKSKRDQRDDGASLSDKSVLLAGVVTGLLFGLHPIHVESVAWVSERKDVLYSLFFLLALLEYLHYTTEQEALSPSRGFMGFQRKYLSILLLFFLAVLSKPMAITFPLVLLILDWFPLQRLRTAVGRRRAVLEKTPFFIIGIIFVLLALFSQKAAHAIAERNPIPLAAKIMNAVKSSAGYLANMVWPVDLMPFYPHPYWENPVLTSAQYMIPALTVMFTTTCCIVLMKSQKLWLAVWTSYILMLFPVLGIIQIGAQGMADRYMYLPSVGPFFIMGIITGRIRERIITSEAKKRVTALFIIVLCIVLVLLSNATVKQIHIWKDGVTLWSYEIKTLEKKSAPPDQFVLWTAYSGIAFAHMRNGIYESAINGFSKVILLKPDDVNAYQQRGIAYAKLGRLDEAIKDFNACISINPYAPEYYYNRGTAFARRGSFGETVQDMTKAILISTEPNANYYWNRGIAYIKLGRLKEGERDLTEAKKLKKRSSAGMQ